MTTWDRIRDGIEDLEFTISQSLSANRDVGMGKISEAAASPQSHPAPPQHRGELNLAPGRMTRASMTDFCIRPPEPPRVTNPA